jgi:hypothetical protein
MLIVFCFPIGKAVVALSVGTGGGCGGKNVRLTESSLLQEPSTDVGDAIARDNCVLDIALASGHGGAINHDAVCALLAKCLQDVSSVVSSMFCLFALLLGF